MSTKIQEKQSTYEKTMDFWSNIHEFSMKKLVAAAFTANIEKITVVGPQFSGKTCFFVNLGVPGRTQKSWKLAAHFDKKILKIMSPSKITFFSIWGWLCKASGSILEYLGVPKGSPGPFLAICPPPHHLPHSLHPSSQNPFKLYTFNPTQPQKEPTTPKT